MTFEEAMQAFEELDDFDAKGYARIYNKYFEENLDERFFLFQNSPDGQAFQIWRQLFQMSQLKLILIKTKRKFRWSIKKRAEALSLLSDCLRKMSKVMSDVTISKINLN